MLDLRALSIRQPWAHAILHQGKDIENRGRCHPRRGLTLIHASAAMDIEYWAEAAEFMRSINRGPATPPSILERGAIIGAVDVLDCVDSSDSPWWMGPRGYVLANPRPIQPIPCKGTVTPLFWLPPLDVREQAMRALGVSV